MIFIDAYQRKISFFLSQALRLLDKDGIILADNVLYKGYVMSDYNKHKQQYCRKKPTRIFKRSKRKSNLETKILEVGDGLAVSKKKIK